MCLKAVDKKRRRTPGIGYKLAQRRNGSYFSCDYRDKFGKVEYPLNKWITDDEDYEIVAKSNQRYRTGFHVFLSEERVRELVRRNNACMDDLVVIKCKYTNVVASDTESDDQYGPVVVARKIMNLGVI